MADEERTPRERVYTWSDHQPDPVEPARVRTYVQGEEAQVSNDRQPDAPPQGTGLTKRSGPKDDDGPTLEELREKAKKLDISGRSKMSKDELAAAVAEAS